MALASRNPALAPVITFSKTGGQWITVGAVMAKKKTASIECPECGGRYHYNKLACPKCGAENQRRKQRETAISTERHFELLHNTAEWTKRMGGIKQAKKRLAEVAEFVEPFGGLEAALQYLDRYEQLCKEQR